VARRARTVVGAILVATLGTACAALLGVDDVDYGPGGDASAPFDGTTDGAAGDGAANDGPGNDGGVLTDASDASLSYDATPFVLQHLGSPPTVLATDGFSLFWAAGSQIYRSDGGIEAGVPFFDAGSAIQQLVVDISGYVVWSTLNAIESSPVAAPAVIDIFKDYRPFGVADSKVYFRAGNPTAYQINTCAVNSPCQDSGAALGAPYPGLSEIVGSSTVVYFLADIADAGGRGVFACAQSGRCLDGSAPSVPTGPQAAALSLEGKSLYWVENAAVMTTATAFTAKQPKFVANGEMSPRAVVSDGVYAYWTSAVGVRAKLRRRSLRPSTERRPRSSCSEIGSCGFRRRPKTSSPPCARSDRRRRRLRGVAPVNPADRFDCGICLADLV
jgi:hypothetical protein